jgi:hypothetical protein
MTNHGKATEEKLSEIDDACQRGRKNSIIALAGVPGTGKSMMGSIAAQRLATQIEMVREVQFHPAYSYEEFVEGMRIDESGGVAVHPGIFLEWNQKALDDPGNQYVLLIEELTRANVSAVLGELMTYIEYRDRQFTTLYSRNGVKVAENLLIIATYNPTDRSAIEVDAALLRRLRIIQCPPSTDQLAEMLGTKLPPDVIAALQQLFTACATKFPEEYEDFMPFGHGVFATVENEYPDLHRLWIERIRHFLRRPLAEPHKFTDVIEENYPWRDRNYRVSHPGGVQSPAAAAAQPTTGTAGPAEAGAASPSGGETPGRQASTTAGPEAPAANEEPSAPAT